MPKEPASEETLQKVVSNLNAIEAGVTLTAQRSGTSPTAKDIDDLRQSINMLRDAVIALAKKLK